MTGDFFQVAEPGGKDLGIGERGREQNKLNALRNIHEGLLPDFSASPIINVMALVKDDRLDPCDGERRRETERFRLGPLFEQKIEEDLRGHNNNLGIGLKADISCHETHRGIWELLGEIGELLIGQGLDGSRVEDATTARQYLVNGRLAHERLTTPCLGTNQNIVILVNGFERVLLEGIQGEGEGTGWKICGRFS